MTTYRVASRRSALAMAQTKWVIEELKKLDPNAEFEIVPMVTRGDIVQDVALSKVGGKGLFVSELEDAIQKQRVDLAVHSLKDVPSTLADGLVIGAIPEREDPRDAIVLHRPDNVATIAPGSRVGTSSLRRQTQLRRMQSDLQFETLRGNIDTRLGRVKRGDMDAIVLAAAGLRRLGFAEEISFLLEPEVCLPAIGQGALGIECRADAAIRGLLDQFTDRSTAITTTAERALLHRLQGGCQVPIAGYAQVLDDGRVHLRGYVATVSGDQAWFAEAVGTDPMDVGHLVADRLIADGAKFSPETT